MSRFLVPSSAPCLLSVCKWPNDSCLTNGSSLLGQMLNLLLVEQSHWDREEALKLLCSTGGRCLGTWWEWVSEVLPELLQLLVGALGQALFPKQNCPRAPLLSPVPDVWREFSISQVQSLLSLPLSSAATSKDLLRILFARTVLSATVKAVFLSLKNSTWGIIGTNAFLFLGWNLGVKLYPITAMKALLGFTHFNYIFHFCFLDVSLSSQNFKLKLSCV